MLRLIGKLSFDHLWAAKSLRVGLMCLLLLAACTQEDHLRERNSTTVRFSLVTHAEDAEVTPTRAKAANMAAGTTVRVLAYRRANGAAQAVLSSACYAGEATYKVTDLGALQADSDPMQLVAGNYDFYALTPALTVDHSGNEPKVEVSHRQDYAVSLTSGTITSENDRVNLHALERRCALLTFETDLKEGVTGITSAQITAVSLTAMTDEPLTGTGIAKLTATGANTELTLSEFEYPNPEMKYQAKGQIVVLPKEEAPFTLAMGVCFNGSATPLPLKADLERIRFEPGNRYAFAIRFRQPGDIYMELVLAVTPWQKEILSGNIGEIGGLPTSVIVLGQWTVDTINTSIGNLGDISSVTSVSNWTINKLNGSIGGLGDIDINNGVGEWEDPDNKLNGSIGGLGDVNINNGVSGWEDSDNKLNGSIGGLGDVNINSGVSGWEDCNGSYEFGK